MEISRALLALSQIKGFGRKKLYLISKGILQNITDANRLLDYLSGNYKKNDIISLEEAESYFAYADAQIERCEQLGVKIVTKYSEEYPEKFRQSKNPPVLYFYKGNHGALKERCIGLIGTRKVSARGSMYGERLSSLLAEQGYVIVSGLAAGCDTAAHTGCVKVSKPTVAVLGNGLDSVYPKKNTELARQILDTGGCIISEYPLGQQATAYTLVERDRLQAYLSDLLVVIETGVKGGSYHAIKEAEEMGRKIASIAYPEAHYKENPDARGNKMLIEASKAYGISDKASLDTLLKEVFEDIADNKKNCIKDEVDSVQLSLF